MSTKKPKTKVKLHIKGKIRNPLAHVSLKKKARQLNVDVISVKKGSWGTITFVVHGEKQRLWEIINWTQGHFRIFIVLDEVNFEFE
jgi:hypothetical protein